MFTIDLVEGKDTPKYRGKPKYHEHGKTGRLLLHLCEGILKQANFVILDFDFSLIVAIIVLKKMGVYTSALIKNRRFLQERNVQDELLAQSDTCVLLELPFSVQILHILVFAQK